MTPRKFNTTLQEFFSGERASWIKPPGPNNAAFWQSTRRKWAGAFNRNPPNGLKANGKNSGLPHWKYWTLNKRPWNKPLSETATKPSEQRRQNGTA